MGVCLMERVTVFDKDMPKIGLHVRTATQGEEFDLVQEFIEYYCTKFLHNNKTNNLAVFIEPHVASGFPDIVFASYSPTILDNWSTARKGLSTVELKVLSFLLIKAGINGDTIMSALRLPEKKVIQSLEKLMDSNLIVRRNKAWYPNGKKDIYSITKLVSVEAKTTNMSKVADQSFINTWFASHSYALTNTASPQVGTVRKFENSGIGLYCRSKQFKKVVEAKRFSLPSSYLSLQFNEWIGNAFA